MTKQLTLTEPEITTPLPATPWGAIAAVTIALSVFSITLGLTYPLLALLLERQGVSETWIGLSAAMTPLGLIIASPLIPVVVQRVGAWHFAVSCSVLAIALFLALGAWPSLWPWFPLRFLLGISTGGLFIITETWINQLATPASRGRVMGLYATVLSLGFALGPLLMAFTGTTGWTPFLVGAATGLISLVALLSVRSALPAFREEQSDFKLLLKFLPLAPVLIVAVGAMAFFDQASLSFFPLYGLGHGLSETTVAYALTVLIGGNIVFQFPLGWLADRIAPWLLMLACAIMTVAGGLLLPWVINDAMLLWPMLFIWGGAAFGSYTLSLVDLGRRFSGAMLLAGNAALAMMWGVGGIVGPALTGGLISLLGLNGLPLILAVVYGMFALLLVGRGWMFGGVSQNLGE